MRLIVHLRKIIRNNLSEQLAASVFCVFQQDHKSSKTIKIYVILGFRLDVDEICALLGYYAA